MQRGSIIKSRRKNGSEVWEFRWRDRTGGTAVYRRIVLGTTRDLAHKHAARAAADGILREVNRWDVRIRRETITFGQLAQHYCQRELNPDNTWKSYSTKVAYAGYLRRWIQPRWREQRLFEFKPIEVETWLRQLPLARASCSKIKNLMSAIFNHARRYELFDRNPIELVRSSSKRRRVPDVLTIDEIRRLLGAVKPKYRTLIFLDVCTGLRQSELFGLKWGDIDFASQQIRVMRSVVHGVIGPCKTESSLKPIPMESELAAMLRSWKAQARYTADDDWVFASRHSRGKRPMWGQAVVRRGIRPVAAKLGIDKRIGWHTFRHSYSTLLRSLGIDIKVQQDLLRHSSARLTLDTYTQAVTPAKRAAQRAVLGVLAQEKRARESLIGCPVTDRRAAIKRCLHRHVGQPVLDDLAAGRCAIRRPAWTGNFRF